MTHCFTTNIKVDSDNANQKLGKALSHLASLVHGLWYRVEDGYYQILIDNDAFFASEAASNLLEQYQAKLRGNRDLQGVEVTNVATYAFVLTGSVPYVHMIRTFLEERHTEATGPQKNTITIALQRADAVKSRIETREAAIKSACAKSSTIGSSSMGAFDDSHGFDDDFADTQPWGRFVTAAQSDDDEDPWAADKLTQNVTIAQETILYEASKIVLVPLALSATFGHPTNLTMPAIEANQLSTTADVSISFNVINPSQLMIDIFHRTADTTAVNSFEQESNVLEKLFTADESRFVNVLTNYLATHQVQTPPAKFVTQYRYNKSKGFTVTAVGLALTTAQAQQLQAALPEMVYATALDISYQTTASLPAPEATATAGGAAGAATNTAINSSQTQPPMLSRLNRHSQQFFAKRDTESSVNWSVHPKSKAGTQYYCNFAETSDETPKALVNALKAKGFCAKYYPLPKAKTAKHSVVINFDKSQAVSPPSSPR